MTHGLPSKNSSWETPLVCYRPYPHFSCLSDCYNYSSLQFLPPAGRLSLLTTLYVARPCCVHHSLKTHVYVCLYTAKASKICFTSLSTTFFSIGFWKAWTTLHHLRRGWATNQTKKIDMICLAPNRHTMSIESYMWHCVASTTTLVLTQPKLTYIHKYLTLSYISRSFQLYCRRPWRASGQNCLRVHKLRGHGHHVL